jgi:hypothetical protein
MNKRKDQTKEYFDVRIDFENKMMMRELFPKFLGFYK